ncbi:MAG: coproporphyrinogen III oxidase [Rhodospirillales bacterium]|nr:coproporphyrinogen III oxidase [Rhodospirillales bacterium]
MFGIYIHWPFCLSKCPYCDFNSHVTAQIDEQQWQQAYQQELAYIAEKTSDKIVTSLYFGGGTPSLMAPQTVAFVIDTVRRYWRTANDLEITLEANPTSVERGKFQDLVQAGVTRVSLGVQALRQEDLKFLGRQHSAQEARQALELAYDTFDRVSFDLIYARPGQTIAAWEQELTEALTLARAGHLSLYQLTIEPGTAFETMYRRKEFRLPDQDLGAELYEMTRSLAASHGLQNYEISNYARPGEESRHNLTYWRYQDYAGIGPGAHGRLTLAEKKIATRARRAPKIWLEQVAAQGHGYHPFEALSDQDRVKECLLMGLRLPEGVPFSRLASEGGPDWEKSLNKSRLKTLITHGFVTRSDTFIAASESGRQRLDYVLGEILAD